MLKAGMFLGGVAISFLVPNEGGDVCNRSKGVSRAENASMETVALFRGLQLALREANTVTMMHSDSVKSPCRIIRRDDIWEPCRNRLVIALRFKGGSFIILSRW